MSLVKPAAGAMPAANPILGNQPPNYVTDPVPTQEYTAEVAEQTYTPEPTNAVPVQPARPNAVAAVAANTSIISPETVANLEAKGLKFDFTSFPRIKLPNGGGFNDSDGTEYGKSFTCQIIDYRPFWLYKASVFNKAEKAKLAYSYDQEITTQDLPVQQVVDDWAREGRTFEVKKYLEVYVMMDAPGELWDGELRSLSIPMTSIGRFTAFVQKCVMKFGSEKNVLCRMSVGKEVTTVANPFFPWAFDVSQ